MISSRTHIGVAFLITLSLIAIPSAHAGTYGTITVQGDVAPDCTITSMPGLAELGELGQSSSKAIIFDFSCNAPFEYTLTSLNGALAHTTQSGVSGFATSIDYTVDISIPTDGATAIADSCASAEIALGSVTCTFTDSGTEIALNKTGGLTLNWSAPPPGAATPLLAGDYADSLTLTIAMQP